MFPAYSTRACPGGVLNQLLASKGMLGFAPSSAVEGFVLSHGRERSLVGRPGLDSAGGSDPWPTAEMEVWAVVGHRPLAGDGATPRALRAASSRSRSRVKWSVCVEGSGGPPGTRPRREAAAHGSGSGADGWRRPKAIRWFRPDAARFAREQSGTTGRKSSSRPISDNHQHKSSARSNRQLSFIQNVD